MEIKTFNYINAKELPLDILKKCDSLNLRENGQMRKALYDSNYKKTIITILDDNKLLAWSLLIFGGYKKNLLNIYVRKENRRQNLCSLLVDLNYKLKGNKDMFISPSNPPKGFLNFIKRKKLLWNQK